MILWEKNLFLFTRLNFFFSVRDKKATEWSLQDLRIEFWSFQATTQPSLTHFPEQILRFRVRLWTPVDATMNSPPCCTEKWRQVHTEADRHLLGLPSPVNMSRQNPSVAGYSLIPTKLWTVANFPLLLLQEGVRNMIPFLQGDCGHVHLLWPQQGSWGLKVMRRRGSHGKGVW